MSISIKEYFALAGSAFTNADAKIIGPVLGELQKEGFVTPEEVVRAAHSENSPLRVYFEWDDSKAANHYREGQARDMLRSIRVRYTNDGREFATRSHKIEVTPQPREQRAPIAFERDRNDDVHTLAAAMLRDLDAWCIKYAPYSAAIW